jgi:hypothetical protein
LRYAINPYFSSCIVSNRNDNYKSALKFNALFFYGRALDAEERRLMFAYSKKEYESIDPVELPAEITDAQVTSGVGTDEVLRW